MLSSGLAERPSRWVGFLMLGWGLLAGQAAPAAQRLDSYYAHPARADRYGVLAPWHEGLNGQLDERLRIAADVMKRYPWVDTDKAVMAAPDFVYNSHWSIGDDGTIVIPPTNDWMCGDLSQRAWSIIRGLTAYYAYSGDPMAFVYIPLTADYILAYAQTPADHDWPRFPIATPTRGKAYGPCDPAARNQLDLCAIIGTEMLRAYKLTGKAAYRDAACHWGDVFAAHAQLDDPGLPPWNRYVDPSVVGWSDVLTGSITLILDFLDELIELGHRGPDDALVKARDAGRDYVRNHLLERWLVNDTWGRNYWDWDNPVQCGITSMIGDYFLENRDVFPWWRTDVRNMLSLVFNRNGVDPHSHGEMYHGAWAFPESSTCCGTSLSYNQYTAGPTFLRYALYADDAWAREIGRRMMIMATYDSDRNGVVRDGLFGQSVATGEWSNLAHPWPLCQVTEALGLAPALLGPNRENHIMRSTSVVQHVVYDRGAVRYRTFDAPGAVVDTLRLAFEPQQVTADGQALALRDSVTGNGYTAQALGNGDYLVHIRHDGLTDISVTGAADPQRQIDNDALDYDGSWQVEAANAGVGATVHVADAAGATMTCAFEGNQVRLIGPVGPGGGWADIYLDGTRQLTLVECWNPSVRTGQVLYRRSGLAAGRHELKLVTRGRSNPLSGGTRVAIDAVQVSAAQGRADDGVGSGPGGPQRMIFGYPHRQDYRDQNGYTWRPATEMVIRSGYGTDAVEASWWTQRRSMYIGNAQDEELYRYGVHGEAFWVNLTVKPGRYRVHLLFADTPLHWFLERDRYGRRVSHTVTAAINGRTVIDNVNVAAAAGGLFRAADYWFDDIAAENGAVAIHLQSGAGGEAIIQALELEPDPGPSRETYTCIRGRRNLLANGDFVDDFERIPAAHRFLAEAPTGWRFEPADDVDNGIQNIAGWDPLDVIAAWLSPGDRLVQVAESVRLQAGDSYRLAVRLQGKGREGQAASTAVGNRAGVTFYWVSDPKHPFAGQQGRDWGAIAELACTIDRDLHWYNLRQDVTVLPEQHDKFVAAAGWYEAGTGSDDSYAFFSEIFFGHPLGVVEMLKD